MRTTFALLASLALVNCGGDDGGGGGGGSIGLDELGSELGRITCGKIFECCSSAEVMDMFAGIDPPITTEAECINFYNGFVTALLLGPAQDAVERGTLIYHADLAGDCYGAFEAASCEEIQNGFGMEGAPVEGCEDIFEGTVTDGGECFTDLECISGDCDGDSLGGEDPGVCITPPGNGDPCETFGCADGFYCETNGGPDGTCMPAQADGADCVFDEECQSDFCADDNTCQPEPAQCFG